MAERSGGLWRRRQGSSWRREWHRSVVPKRGVGTAGIIVNAGFAESNPEV